MGGVFVLNATLNVGSSPECVVAADVNNDGSVDLVTANYNAGTLTVFTNGAVGPNNRSVFIQGNPWTSSGTLASGYPAPVLSESTGLPVGIGFTNGIFSGTPTVVGMTELTNVSVTASNAFGVSPGSFQLIAYQAPLVPGLASYNAGENATFGLSLANLLTNDTEPNFQVSGGFDYYFPLSVTAVSATSTNGGTTGLFVSSFTYRPVNNFIGQDEFTYTFQDAIGLTAQGTVLMTVYPSPIAGTNILSTAQNTALMISTTNLTANDTDPSGFPLSVLTASFTSTNGGTVRLFSGIITYTPVANYTGLDAFTYTLIDSVGGTNQGTAQVIVTAPGSPAYNTVQMTPPSPDGGTIGLGFTGLPGQTYYLQSATNIFGPFVDVPPPIVADGNGLVSDTITIPPASPGQYYRISPVP